MQQHTGEHQTPTNVCIRLHDKTIYDIVRQNTERKTKNGRKEQTGEQSWQKKLNTFYPRHDHHNKTKPGHTILCLARINLQLKTAQNVCTRLLTK